MHFPDDLYYSDDHEWLKVEGSRGIIGITEYAQAELGDVVYVELPSVGDEFEAGDNFGVVESVKSVSDLYIPVSGRVVEVNEELDDSPELVNQDPYGKGWMIVVELDDPEETADLMSSAEYESFIKESE
ncbi:glycine cleavage system protein GcvH [Calorimonas adulescens]|jgi:glycine cleavage system H protein|uniref:Glycine cleavage system H protein n=1 Tax=Calorimonas adulescens TaxID=2606906 RepID=A0A5D8QCT3_9THEO|nr:glycine cleavage system protein GcvH [Calorimonas adulescens]TZE81148.1 glycine cleavage system protein GcvH [Calorimonas adulescens]